MIRRVVGNSMLPTLKPGTLVLATASLKPKVGRLVIVNNNGVEVVKRLVHIKGDRLYIVGDNAQESTDSRNFGWLKDNCLLATVIWPFNK
ncbi:MAG: S24 family peptidase [Candidatus Saccharimonadales bacterium]